MSGSGEKFSRKQDRAITALLNCASLTDAAAQCGVGASTLRRWLGQPPFKAAYLAARRQVVEHAITQMQQACSRAVETLVAIMESQDASASARVAAAQGILQMAMKGIELEELDLRLRALEAYNQEQHR